MAAESLVRLNQFTVQRDSLGFRRLITWRWASPDRLDHPVASGDLRAGTQWARSGALFAPYLEILDAEFDFGRLSNESIGEALDAEFPYRPADFVIYAH